MSKLGSGRKRVGSGPGRVSAGPKVADRFYKSPEWRNFVASLITVRGRRCEVCGKTHEDDGKPVRLIGDHTVERRDGGPDLEPANVKLMCWSCHNAKTAQARARRLGRLG